jgi:short-subunit dehydrogenase
MITSAIKTPVLINGIPNALWMSPDEVVSLPLKALENNKKVIVMPDWKKPSLYVAYCTQLDHSLGHIKKGGRARHEIIGENGILS